MDIFAVILSVLVSGVLEGSYYALFGMGMGVASSLLRIINIAHGPFIILGSYFCYYFSMELGFDPLVALVMTIPCFFLIGFAFFKYGIHLAIAEERFGEDMSYILTFGVALILINLELLLFSPNIRIIRTPFSNLSLTVGELQVTYLRILAPVAAVLMGVLLELFLFRSDFGTALKALTEDRETGIMMGINFPRVAAVTFGLSLVTCAIAGFMFGLTHFFTGSMGLLLLAKAFTVIALGGVGSIRGTIVASMLVGIAEALTAFFFSAAYQNAVTLLLLIIVLLARPKGIFGKA